MKISAVISVYNEEKRIAACLESVKFADEIVVVNNSSTDKTEEVARKYTDKVFRQENNPLYIDLLKNLGFEKATGDWILSLDADETVSKELAEEIREVTINSDKDAYYIPRKNIIFGKWIEHTGWYPDNQLRLFKKGAGKYITKHVHEQLNIEGEKGYLQNHIIHDNYSSIKDFLQKTVFMYAPNEAENMLERGYKFSRMDAIRFPVNEFLSRFFAREGYKDGLHGLVLSMLMAFYHFLIFAYIWEKKDFVQESPKYFLEETEDEIKKVNKDIMFWFYNEKLKSIKNPINRNLQRVLKKVPH